MPDREKVAEPATKRARHRHREKWRRGKPGSTDIGKATDIYEVEVKPGHKYVRPVAEAAVTQAKPGRGGIFEQSPYRIGLAVVRVSVRSAIRFNDRQFSRIDTRVLIRLIGSVEIPWAENARIASRLRKRRTS